jgi:hypothetical protein
MRAALVALLVAGSLAACSESPEDVRADYCDQVTEQQAGLTDTLADDSPDALLRALPVFSGLAEEAPRDVADEWAVLIDALEGLDEALDEAGVDAATYDAQEPPEGVTPEQQDSIARAADQLFRPDVVTAYEGVKQHAKDVCKTPLFQ